MPNFGYEFDLIEEDDLLIEVDYFEYTGHEYAPLNILVLFSLSSTCYRLYGEP